MPRGVPERGCIYIPGSSRGGVPNIFRPPGRSGGPPPPGCGGGRAAPHSMPISGRQQQRQRRHDSRRSAADVASITCTQRSSAGGRRHDQQTGAAASEKRQAGQHPGQGSGARAQSHRTPFQIHRTPIQGSEKPEIKSCHTDNNRKRKKKVITGRVCCTHSAAIWSFLSDAASSPCWAAWLLRAGDPLGPCWAARLPIRKRRVLLGRICCGLLSVAAACCVRWAAWRASSYTGGGDPGRGVGCAVVV